MNWPSVLPDQPAGASALCFLPGAPADERTGGGALSYSPALAQWEPAAEA